MLDPGRAGRGSHNGVRVHLSGPAWLVLGESWNRGWRASCQGRSLGEPVPIDGYANGWQTAPGCRSVKFAFAPNRLVLWACLVSLAASLALLALVAVGAYRRRREPVRAVRPLQPDDIPGDERPTRWPPGRAALAGLVSLAVLGFMLGTGAGLAIAPALALTVALVLWRGVGARTLTLAAAGLLVIAVPALYLLDPATDRGGFNGEYAVEQLAPNWVATVALGLLGLAVWRTLRRARPAAPPDRSAPARSGSSR